MTYVCFFVLCLFDIILDIFKKKIKMYTVNTIVQSLLVLFDV